jgi:serine/threonine protein phosphatase 1
MSPLPMPGWSPTLVLTIRTNPSSLGSPPDFARKPRSDGLWIVHGHRIVDAPRAENGVISVDTGASAICHLTAALIAPDGLDFVATWKPGT